MAVLTGRTRGETALADASMAAPFREPTDQIITIEHILGWLVLLGSMAKCVLR
jgi:hypothetical protein